MENSTENSTESREENMKENIEENGTNGKKESSTGKAQKIVRILVAVLVVAVVGIGVYANRQASKVKQTEVKEENLQVSEEMEEELKDAYVNVAVFGVNERSAEDKTADSDAVYVASLDTDSKEVRLLPVYGNTMMKRDGSEIKMKEAYAGGGAEEAIAVLNETLDLNIKDYVSMDLGALVEIVDTLGGIEIDVKQDEIPHINGYAQSIAKAYGKETAAVEAEGKQKLDGPQAAGYCRIRVTDGGDVKRADRQKEVIGQVFQKLEEADFSQVDKILDALLPQLETSFDKSEIIAYAADAPDYKISSIPAYPRAIKEQERKEKKEGEQFTDYEEIVEGTDCEKDVADIHKELFGDGAK